MILQFTIDDVCRLFTIELIFPGFSGLFFKNQLKIQLRKLDVNFNPTFGFDKLDPNSLSTRKFLDFFEPCEPHLIAFSDSTC